MKMPIISIDLHEYHQSLPFGHWEHYALVNVSRGHRGHAYRLTPASRARLQKVIHPDTTKPFEGIAIYPDCTETFEYGWIWYRPVKGD